VQHDAPILKAYPCPITDIAVIVPFKGMFSLIKKRFSLSLTSIPSLPMVQYAVWRDITFIGPLLGAPMAAILLEILAASNVKRLFLFGVCGSISPGIEIGDLFIPLGGISEEGTSKAYELDIHPPTPSPVILKTLKSRLCESSLAFKCGKVWTTDAPFRETPTKIAHFREQGANVVEMEFSALATVSRFLGLDFAAVFVVSDECFHDTWKSGFRDQAFLKKFKLLTDIMAGFSEI